MAFAHLHLHSEYSLLDGAIKVEELVKRVQEIGQTAVAITDHGWVAGSVKFVKSCKDAGIKPIIGCEVYVAKQDSYTEPAKSPGDNYHLTLLARTAEGYTNLLRLISKAHTGGLYYKPRIDLNLLEEHSAGITLLTGCIGAQVPQLLVHGQEKEARRLVERYQRIFGKHVWIELMNHGSTDGIEHVKAEEDGKVLMGETELNDALLSLGDSSGIGFVATNDAHYLLRDHGDAHDSLLCLQVASFKDDEKRGLMFPGAKHRAWEFYVKSEEEMRKVERGRHSRARRWDEACRNTALVADSVDDGVLLLDQKILPQYDIPDDPEFELFLKTGTIL